MKMKLRSIRALIAKGESATLELKRSTGEVREALQTICAFANGKGGQVVIGAKPSGEIVGQLVSEQTLHDIAAARDRFEPPIEIEVERVEVSATLALLVLTVAGSNDSVPFTYDGRPFERVGKTTRKMPKERYEALLLERMHSRRRWENQSADRVALKDIDREEVLRIVKNMEGAERLSGPSVRSVADALDRLGLRQDGQLINAAVVLFGKKFMPDYPQCEIRMARFLGTTKNEFMDERSVRAPAFKLLEEAQLFCQRHLPRAATFVDTQMERVETPLIPPLALREILVNAIIHRDYSNAGGAMFLAIFDDRVEIWSTGTFPRGITPEKLKRRHPSVLRNPIVADAFHRTGLIERWGRGTNRVAEMCKSAGIAPPDFEEIAGAAVVTFRVPVAQLRAIGAESGAESRAGSRADSEAGSLDQRVLDALVAGEQSKSALAKRLELSSITGHLNRTVVQLLERGHVELTLPSKPNSRLQKYRLTAAGRAVIQPAARRRRKR
jgi:ATP-dependent DNA helicase RecG